MAKDRFLSLPSVISKNLFFSKSSVILYLKAYGKTISNFVEKARNRQHDGFNISCIKNYNVHLHFSTRDFIIKTLKYCSVDTPYKLVTITLNERMRKLSP